jgi:hypothetical protein
MQLLHRNTPGVSRHFKEFFTSWIAWPFLSALFAAATALLAVGAVALAVLWSAPL